MQRGYFITAWEDIRNSPGWVAKLLLLGLVNLIPLFGQVVTCGYLYGWARDMAWGLHAPLPQRIFGNEDGNLYRRGLCILVIGVVFSLAPWLLNTVGAFFADGLAYQRSSSMALATGCATMLLSACLLVLSALVQLLAWVGFMRTSIYGRLSAGFQLSKLWGMLRYDTAGLLRILGMAVLVGLGFSVVLALVAGFAAVLLMPPVLALMAHASTATSLDVGSVLCMLFLVALLCLLATYALSVASSFCSLLTARALGYWTRQFDVAQWQGQDDPLPFELQRQYSKSQR